MQNETSQKYFESLRQDVERLVRRVDETPGACITGIVFCQEPPGIVHVTNIENKGDDLIRVHLVLSTLVAEMQEKGKQGRIPFQEFSSGNKPIGDAPEEIADELARMVLVTGMDGSHSMRCTELAQKYIVSRRV